jgi:hypothetical protein
MDGFFHLEMAANLLELLERLFGLFPKCALKSLNNQADFDSALLMSSKFLLGRDRKR